MVLTDWHALLNGATGYTMLPGATQESIAEHEEQLGATLPGQLRKLYLVSDGVFDQVGLWYVVWPLAELRRRNEQLWSTGIPAELLAFGDDGTAAPFCVPRDGGPGVFSWHPVEGVPHWLANGVDDFWHGWTTGTIST